MGRWPGRTCSPPLRGGVRGGGKPWQSAVLSSSSAGVRCWWFAPSRSVEFAAGASFLSPPGDSLFFAPAKKSKQKKAVPCVAPLRGALRCSWPGGRARTRRPIGASNRRALPYPPTTALLGAYEGEGKSKALRLVGCANIARAKRAPAVAGDVAVASIFAAGEGRRAVDGPVPFVAPRSAGLRGVWKPAHV